MTYRDSLHPWCVIRHLPNAQRVVVARFRKRGEAEGYVRSLQRMTPDAVYSLIFEPPTQDEAEAAINQATSFDVSKQISLFESSS